MLNTTKTERFKSTEKCVIQVPLGLSKSDFNARGNNNNNNKNSATLRYPFSSEKKKKKRLNFHQQC